MLDNSPSFTIAAEKVNSVWDEAQSVFEIHKNELGSWSESELDVDRAMYEQAEARGYLVAYVLRNSAKSLCGYVVYWLNSVGHYKQELWAQSDTFFVLPEERNKGLGDLLLDYSEADLKARGANVVQVTVRADNPQGLALAMLLKRRDYLRKNIGYAKRF